MSSLANMSFEQSSLPGIEQMYDQWIHSQIETALKESDDPATESIPHETVKGRWSAKKNVLQTALG